MSSALDDKASEPDDDALVATLGGTKPHWDALMRLVEAVDGVTVAWKFYGKKYGWQVKALRKKKALLYLIPHAGSFLAGMGVSDSALVALRASDLPLELVAAITEAPRFPEGHPARIEVTGAAEADLVARLLTIAAAS